METRYKYSKDLLWGTGIMLVIFIVLAFFVPPFKWAAAMMGIMFIVAIILYKTQKNNELVIDDYGIREGKTINYKWYQIDHCYYELRLEGSAARPHRYPYLVIVLHGGKKVSVSLLEYSIKKKALLKTIDEASGRSLCRKNDADSKYEKEVEKKEYKNMIIGTIIALIFVLVWIVCSME